jgi:hypothetical protein
MASPYNAERIHRWGKSHMINKQRRPLAAAAFCAAIFACTVSDASNSNAGAAGLFGTPTAAEMRAAPPSPSAGTMRDGLRGPAAGALRHRLVSLNLNELGRVVPVGPGASVAADRLERAKNLRGAVMLELFPGVNVTAERTDVEAPNEGGFVWVGEDRGPRHAFVTLSISNNEIVGQIQSDGKLYSIEPVSGPLHRIIEIDQTKIKDDMHPPLLLEGSGNRTEAPVPSPDAVAPMLNTTIRVLVANTVTARNEIGTSTQMQARINLAISLANQAFTRSGALITFQRVGGLTEVNYNEALYYGGLNSSANYLGVLCDLSNINCASSGVANNRAAAFGPVRTKRNTVAADLVVLMRKQGAACGIAWEPNLNGTVLAANHVYGFSVVTSTKVSPYNCIEAHALAHEAGHNQGLNHDRVQHKLDYGLATPPASQFNFGHVNTNKKFVTIMSYISNCPGCTRIGYFSTPLRKYPNATTGTPVGVAAGIPGPYGAADNVRRLNLNKAIVGAYR